MRSHIEIGTNHHNKSFALRLALKETLRGTRKWPFKQALTSNFIRPSDVMLFLELSGFYNVRRWLDEGANGIN